MGIKNSELIEKAKAAGVDPEEFDSEEDLQKALEDADADKNKNDDNDDDDDTKDYEYLKQEAKKAFAARDAAKQDARKLREKIKEMEELVKSAPPKEELETLKSELADLKKFKAEIDAAKEEEELKKKTEIERKEIEFNKTMERIQAEMNEKLSELNKQLEESKSVLEKKESEIRNLRGFRLQSSIISLATKKNAYKPEQIYKLLKDDFVYDEDLDKFYYPVYNERGKLVDELTVEERVSKFLDDPENDNLIKSDVKSGFNTKKTDGSKGSDIDTSGYDLKDPNIVRGAEERGLTPEEYVQTLKLRDEKLNKIRGSQNS